MCHREWLSKGRRWHPRSRFDSIVLTLLLGYNDLADEASSTGPCSLDDTREANNGLCALGGRLVMSLAGQTAAQDQLAPEHLEQSVADRTGELSTFLKVSSSATSTLDLEPLLGLILDQLRAVTNHSGAAIMSFEDGVMRILAYPRR
jgi:hypothetical protein